eukprot:scaffold79023_cov30-Phaeocystis_antarctica.AAC.1
MSCSTRAKMLASTCILSYLIYLFGLLDRGSSLIFYSALSSETNESQFGVSLPMLAWEQQDTIGPAAPAAHGHTTTLLGKHKSSRLVVFGGQGQDNSMYAALEPALSTCTRTYMHMHNMHMHMHMHMHM